MRYPEYVRTPTTAKIFYSQKTDVKSRRLLKVKLKNNHTKKMLFIMMNPSKANEIESDNTINKCSYICHHDLENFQIGSFSIVNVYPFYQSNSNRLNECLIKVNAEDKPFYSNEIFENLKTIYSEIKAADYVVLATGGIPDNIEDIEEYEFLLSTIHSYVESLKGEVFLTKADNYSGYLRDGKYSYHLCPNGNPYKITKMKLHQIKNGEFIEFENMDVIQLSSPK